MAVSDKETPFPCSWSTPLTRQQDKGPCKGCLLVLASWRFHLPQYLAVTRWDSGGVCVVEKHVFLLGFAGMMVTLLIIVKGFKIYKVLFHAHTWPQVQRAGQAGPSRYEDTQDQRGTETA